MKNLAFLALLLPGLVAAEVNPPQGSFDPRVRVVDYNPADVVRLTTWYGVSTHVQFGPGEKIVDVAAGDDQAWTIKPRGGNLFIKPKAQKADTNVTIVTDKRVYHFLLVVSPRPERDTSAWKAPNLIYSLSFRYPDEAAAKAEADARKREADAERADVAQRLDAAGREVENTDYWVAGAPEVSPTAVRDNGRFMYLTFSNNRDMPAVYAVESDGTESLINTHVEGNTIVVQRMVRQLALRKGAAVACLVNKAFEFDGGRDNNSGTVAPDVERRVKGVK